MESNGPQHPRSLLERPDKLVAKRGTLDAETSTQMIMIINFYATKDAGMETGGENLGIIKIIPLKIELELSKNPT